MYKPDLCAIDSSEYWWPGDPYQPGDTLRIYRGCYMPDSLFYIRIPPGGPIGVPGSEINCEWHRHWLDSICENKEIILQQYGCNE